MGHFMVSRCALYLATPQGLVLAHERGLRAGDRDRAHPRRGRGHRAQGPAGAADGGRPAPGAAPRAVASWRRMALVVPLAAGGSCRRAPGGGRAGQQAPFSRGGPRLRADPGASGAGRPRERAAPSGARWRSSARTASSRSPGRSSRASSRRRAPRSRASRWRRRATPASRSAATTTTSSRSAAGAWRS